ncbi:MAG: DUF5103 domain-containing protein, partial [Massilibacteroides sp.]|nr:DUF5103 domain-containing protein [Massilibacteroides sp.]
MVKLFLLIVVEAFTVFCSVSAQEVFSTSVLNRQVKSLKIGVAGDWVADPVITLNGEKQLEISFDVLDQGYSRYLYSIRHCNADWTPSSLSPIEYMTGFQGMEIEDFANSTATTTVYSNYRFYLPNDQVQLRVSGNYAVIVYDEAKPDKPLFVACFFVVESVVSIDAGISSITDIDANKAHQQLEFSVNHKNFPISHPLTDLKLFVYQNNRRDNMVTGLTPSAILSDKLVYAHNRNLIFKAGNEYRRMEFLSNQYNGMHVEDIQFHNPYYHVVLYPDHYRHKMSYQYDQDQNGRFFARCSRCEDPDTEGDYYIVHFTLAENEILGGDVFLNGLFLNNNLNEDSRMVYNRESGQYEKFLLLKEGSYNYQYLFV